MARGARGERRDLEVRGGRWQSERAGRGPWAARWAEGLRGPRVRELARAEPGPGPPSLRRSVPPGRPTGRASPGEGEVHEADDGEAEQGDRVRPVEEVYGDVLHLLLVDHAEMHPVVHVVLAQRPAPHARRHGPSPRPAAEPEAPAREGWDPGGGGSAAAAVGAA